MDSELIKDLNITEIIDWYNNKYINPRTKRKIKEKGKLYEFFKDKYEKIFPNDINFFQADHIDPVSLTEIWVIRNNKKEFVYPDYENLLLYKDKNDIVNCFEKDTINYFIHHKINIHPVTSTEIPQEVLNIIEYKEIIINKTIEHLALDVFQLFNNISVFVDHKEYIKLSEDKLNKLYYETFEFFHQNLPENKINTIKELGKDKNIEIYEIKCEQFTEKIFEDKQKFILDIFKFLLDFKDDDVKLMTYYIILGGLSLFIPKIKTDYPDFCFNF
uniref:2-cysteine adaptor domain-containing protein n=1 Tax=viral metagenome TaxID=1070528 RepID=A0A6C0J6I8_9ZZZZ